VISETDVKDWDILPLTPLHELESGSFLRTQNEELFQFVRVEGAYALCKDQFGVSTHIGAMAKVYPLVSK